MMASVLKLVSLNIERHKHIDLVEAFLVKQKPDVVCLQEVFEHDLPRFSHAMGDISYSFEPMGRRPDEPPPGIMGVAIFSRYPIKKSHAYYYSGVQDTLKDSYQGDISTYNNVNRFVLAVEVEKENTVFRIATTHFTWTPDGQPDEMQRSDIRELLKILDGMGEFVFT